MTRKWADQQEYVTRWKYVGAVPTFPQIHPAIIIESWICIWSCLTTPSFKTFVFVFHYLSHFVFHLLSTPDGKHQDLNKTVFVFFIGLKISISIQTECLYSPNGRQHNWISFVSFRGMVDLVMTSPQVLVSHHIAFFLHVVLFAFF